MLFRSWFTIQAAREMGLCGYAKNLSDGTVEVMAEGTKIDLESFIKKVKLGPPFSRVDDIKVDWVSTANQYPDFNIVR